MKKIFKEAHKMTREIVKEYKVDYQAQFRLNLSYLLENKEEQEMIKNYVEEKGLKIVVDNNNLNYYKDKELVAETWGFINKGNTKDFGDTVGIKFHKHTGILKDFGNMSMKKETFEEILRIRTEIRNTIDKYFEELDNIEIGKIEGGPCYIIEKNKELKELNYDYYTKIEQEWLENNRKYIIKTKDEWAKNEVGQMEKIEAYKFEKDNIKAIDKKREERENNKSESKIESEKRYNKLYELAETDISDEDFEDITGLKKENYLI